MAPRTATRPARENDFSNVGKVGRRTGVTLPQGRLDVNGMEEISGIFSSPRKPSPLKQSMSLGDASDERRRYTLRTENVKPARERTADFDKTETCLRSQLQKNLTDIFEAGDQITPRQRQSARKSVLPPRSASPRKSGISGTAKRSKTVDVLNQKGEHNLASSDQADPENQSIPTPKLLSSGPRRFSPEKSPLKDVTNSRSQSVRSVRHEQSQIDDSIHNSIETTEEPTETLEESALQETVAGADAIVDDFVVPAVGDDDQVSIAASNEDDYEEPPLPPPFDDEEADETFEPQRRSNPRSREPTVANSRKKRRSDVLEQEVGPEAISSPAAKRAKRISDQSSKPKQKTKSPAESPAQPTQPKPRGRSPLKNKDSNVKTSSSQQVKISASQQEKLDKIIEKVKPRPGQKKSLHIFRRETTADEDVKHTRSGRISIKPLHWWRNERCIYGGSPGGASLEDGARFPLNSIKEVYRVQEMTESTEKKSKKTKKGKARGRPRTQSAAPAEDEESIQRESESDSEEDEEAEDVNAEPWETEKGIYRGQIAMWDPQQQSHTEEEEEMDLAYAPASIELKEVKGSTFRFAKMLSLKFFGSGIVDLPPNSLKKAKNSRRMHMSFFVAEGRVTVSVGPLGGVENKFSIGRGGWWQVPRGNQYSIENELDKHAKVFFSQACEPAPQSEED